MNAGSEQPYFLEMNTRLQVEHPVTEAITGIDLVEWQIKAAAGELLPLRQDEIHQAGHAIEARITAERADLEFQPATGHVARVAAPADLRFDAGIVDGSEVGLYYDSLLGKLIAFGRTRETSLARLQTGLNELVLLGLPTTQAFLHDAVRHPIFSAGRATTRFVTMAYPEGWRPDSAELRYLRAAASAAWLVDQRGKDTGEVWTNPWLSLRPLRITGAARPAPVAAVLSDEYGSCDLHLSWTRTGVLAEIEGHVIDLGAVEINGDNLFTGGGRLPYLRTETAVCLSRNGVATSATVNLRIERRPMLQKSGAKRDRVDAPLHGLVSQINVSVGDSVMAGTAVIQMEAMKLVHTLGAPGHGIVSSIHCAVGDIVSAGAVLLTLKAAEEKELP